jgi:hypothetical protein
MLVLILSDNHGEDLAFEAIEQTKTDSPECFYQVAQEIYTFWH